MHTSLRDNNTMIGLCYLDPQEMSKFTKIFGLKMVTNMLFKLRNSMVITTCNNNVINIDN